jgi:hypothetical protein
LRHSNRRACFPIKQFHLNAHLSLRQMHKRCRKIKVLPILTSTEPRARISADGGARLPSSHALQLRLVPDRIRYHAHATGSSRCRPAECTKEGAPRHLRQNLQTLHRRTLPNLPQQACHNIMSNIIRSQKRMFEYCLLTTPADPVW